MIREISHDHLTTGVNKYLVVNRSAIVPPLSQLLYITHYRGTCSYRMLLYFEHSAIMNYVYRPNALIKIYVWINRTMLLE